MAKCAKCERKIGYFENKFKYKNKIGEVVDFCPECNEDCQSQILKEKETQEQNKLESTMPEGFHDENSRVIQVSLRKLHLNEENKPNERILNGIKLKKETIPNRYFLDKMSCYCFICLKSFRQDPFKISNRSFEMIKHFKICKNCIPKIEKETARINALIKTYSASLHNIDEKSIVILTKYLSKKNLKFKRSIFEIYKNEKLKNQVYEEDLDLLKEFLGVLSQESRDVFTSDADDYDTQMLIENFCENAIQFLEDLEKIGKILIKNKIKLNYKEILRIMAKSIEKDIKEEYDKLVIPLHKKISNVTKEKKGIVREYLKVAKFNTKLPDEELVEHLFDKFALTYTHNEVNELLSQCKEEAELDEFEAGLGLDRKPKIGSFEKLNGFQFEDYLKKIFKFLGYQVVRTKLSNDQGADLILKKDGRKIVLQAKKYSGTVNNKAIQEVVASKEHYGANDAMVVTTGKFTKSAIELAKSNKVEMWDGKKLKRTISDINSLNPN